MNLKPCPKCGHDKIWQMHRNKKWHCECFKCGTCGRSSRLRAIAKILWNRR